MNILEAQELRRGKKSVRPFSLPPVGAAPLTAPAGPTTAPAAASAPVIPSEPKKRGIVGEALHDVGQTARAVGTGLYSAFADRLPRQVAATALGSDVALGDGGAAQRYVAKQDEDLKRWEMSPEDRENKLFGIVKAGTVQQGLQQIGNSIAPMVAGFGVGAAAASMVDSPVSPIADLVGGVIGAGTLTAPMAYRASKVDYVLQMRDSFKQARPNGTEEEWQKFKASIEDNAKLYGLWEAGPEIVGNMVSMALIKTPAGGILKAIPLIESNAARLLASGVAKLALDMPVEVLTESVTGYNQAKIEYASGLRAEPPTPAGAFVEAAPQTIVMTLATMGLGSVANSLMTDNSGQVQRHKIIRLLNKSGVGRETINDLLDAKDWNGFNASMKKHEAEISKVGAELAEATAGTPAAAVDPNAPKVNPILNPEAAPSVFDAPVGAQPAQDATAVNPLLAQNQPTTNAEDEAAVRRAMDARGPAYAGIRAVEPAPSAGVAAVKEISDKIGLRVIWIDGAPVGGRAIQGAAPAGENTIFLHTDLLTNPKRDPVMMVYAHELTHRSERASPKEYGILRDSVLARAEARASVEEKVASGMSRAAAESEAVAEQVEVLGTDQAFWSEVFAGKEQSFIEHIIQIVTDMAQRVFGTNQAAKAEAIRGAAVSAFQALQAQSQWQNQNQNQTLTTQEAANGVQEGQAQEVAVKQDQTTQSVIDRINSATEQNRKTTVHGTPYTAIVSPMFATEQEAIDWAKSLGIENPQMRSKTRRSTGEKSYWAEFDPTAGMMDERHVPAGLSAKQVLLDRASKAKPATANPAPAPKPSISEVAKLRRESEVAKVERVRLRESKRKAEIEYNKKFKGSGLTRKQAAKSRRIYDYDRGDAPVLSVVIDQFGGINEASAKDFGIDKASIPRSIREKLFPKDGKGSNWNDITWAIENDNLIPGVMRADEVGSHIAGEIESINRLAKENKAQAQSYRQRSEDERGFKRAIIRDDKNAKVRREAVDLREGDVLVRKIEGIPVEFTVSEVEDTTGNIVLKSTLYGKQPVEFFEMVHADKLIREKEVVGGAEDVPFSTKEVLDDSEDGGEKPETLSDTASSIEDDAERDAFARAELEKRAGVPLVQGPKNLAALSQNHVVATAKDLLERLAEGEIDAVEAMESLEAVEKRVGRTVSRAESKAAKEAKMAGESRQQGLPGLEGLAKSPYGTPDDGENGTLFSSKKLTQEDVEEESRRNAASSIQSKVDADYLAAVERGDTATAQRMVDEAAKRAGYDGTWYHATIGKFTVYDLNAPSGELGGGGISVAKTENDARAFVRHRASARGLEEKDIVVIPLYVKASNTFDIKNPEHRAKRVGADNALKMKKPFIWEEMPDELRIAGFDSAKTHEYDMGKYTGKYEDYHNLFLLDPSQIKSADAITRDDQGRVIPPSERFNQQSDDIRFSLAKDDGEGRERQYSISRYLRETLKREWSASYKQKSIQAHYEELQAVTDKHGEKWVMEHLYDLSKETQAEFPLALRPIAASAIIESADKVFRQYGINDDGSNMPSNPEVEALWHETQRLLREEEVYERETGRAIASLRGRYGKINSPVGVRKFINDDLHKKLAAPVIGPVKAPVIEKALNESKTAYDEAIAALEAERAKNAELEENLRVLDEALGKRIGQTEARIRQRSAKSEAYRRGIDEDLAATMAELKAAGMSMEGLSSKPTIEMIQKAVKLYIGIHGADQAKVADFLNRNLGEKLAPATVKALINDAQLALDNAGRAAEKEAPSPRKGEAKPRKGATVINRAPDMTIQGPTSGPTRLFDSGKMWGEGRVLNIGEADAKRLALELTEAGQTVMRGISSNVEVVISNAMRHGRNAAGIEKVLVDSGIDPDTARRMVKNIVRRRAELVRPALETLRQKYAAKGDKVSRTIASAMDKIMSAMELADRASTSQVSGFFDGNAWDESRRIIEEAFGFKSEITRDWFNETMRLYREYEKADEAGNHIKASELHRDMLNRVALIQHGKSGTGKWMAFRSYIQGGMLSGPATHLWNLLNTASRNIEFAFVQSERQMLLGNFRAALAPWMIIGQSSKQAFGVAKRILREGVNPISMRGAGDEAKFGTDPSVASATEWHPWFKKGPLSGMKYIGRALIAADALFRTNIESTEIYIQSYQDAISRGETPSAASKQALGIAGFVTDGSNDAYNKAAAKADELGLKGVDRELNILIDMRNDLDPEIREKALLQGAVETFNDQHPEGLAGLFADSLRHNSWHPASFWLGMFARIGANVFNYGLQTSPLAFASLAWDATIGTYKNQGRYVVRGDELVKRSIRAANGLAVTGAVLALCLKAAADYDEDEDKNKKMRFMLTAKGPRNNDAAKKLWRQQNKPYMMVINGKEYSYKWMGPIATPFAMVGALMDEIRFGDIKQAEEDEGREGDAISRFLPTMLYGMMAITTEELPGQGMVKLADAIYSAEEDSSQFLRNVTRMARDQATSMGTAWIPYSAMVRYLDRIADPTVYTAKNMDGVNTYLYSFLRNVPIARKYALYPMRNIFGEPIQVPDEGGKMGVGERAVRLTFDRFLNNMQKDEDIQFLIKAQRSFVAPTREETQLVTNENGLYGLRKMNDAEYDRYLEIFGGELRTQIAQVRTDYSSTAEAEKWVYKENKSLQKRLSAAKKTAMNWAMYKFLTEKAQKASSNKE